MAAGIRQRHGNRCSQPASRCKCPWQAEVYSPRDGKKIRKLFPTKAAAAAWRNDASTGVRTKVLRAPTPITLEQAGEAAMARGEVAVNPRTGLELPAARGGRDRVATPDECARLLAALPRSDRALWATAMYGGLRRGELLALRVEDVDLANGLIHVRRGWDAVEG